MKNIAHVPKIHNFIHGYAYVCVKGCTHIQGLAIDHNPSSLDVAFSQIPDDRAEALLNGIFRTASNVMFSLSGDSETKQNLETNRLPVTCRKPSEHISTVVQMKKCFLLLCFQYKVLLVHTQKRIGQRFMKFCHCFDADRI